MFRQDLYLLQEFLSRCANIKLAYRPVRVFCSLANNCKSLKFHSSSNQNPRDTKAFFDPLKTFFNE